MEEIDALAAGPVLTAPLGTASNWYERIEKAKAARKMGIQLQAAREPELREIERRQPAWQWHTGDDRA